MANFLRFSTHKFCFNIYDQTENLQFDFVLVQENKNIKTSRKLFFFMNKQIEDFFLYLPTSIMTISFFLQRGKYLSFPNTF